MITYIGLNLKTKRFQVGSTTDFPRRYKQHLKSDMNPEFNRALQKDPEGFYWFISDDDGRTDRSEEQYYLDFYTGSQWCTNISSNATAPPYQGGTKWWTKNDKVTRSVDCPGEGWREKTPYSMTSAIIELNKERMAIVGEDGKSIQAVEMALKSHSQRTDDGKSVRAVEWAKKSAAVTNTQKWKCLTTGHISTPGGLSRYQQKRGLPTGPENRVKLEKENENG